VARAGLAAAAREPEDGEVRLASPGRPHAVGATEFGDRVLLLLMVPGLLFYIPPLLLRPPARHVSFRALPSLHRSSTAPWVASATSISAPGPGLLAGAPGTRSSILPCASSSSTSRPPSSWRCFQRVMSSGFRRAVQSVV